MTSGDWEERFGGIARLYGRSAAESVARAHVLVIGVGGVGSWSAEALARSGVGVITLVDMDDVCITNVNRQLHALTDTLGRPKVSVLAERIRAIHPACRVQEVVDFATADTMETLLALDADVIIDAIDDVSNKCRLIAAARARSVPIVVSGAAGGRVDPAAVQCRDLCDTTSDGMLRDVRRTLRRSYGFPEDRRWEVPTVFSTEAPRYPATDGSVDLVPGPGRSGRLDCAHSFGAASFVTGTFGFAATARALRIVTEPS